MVMAMRKRSGSGSKRQLKEKVVQFYESFFRCEEGENTTTWDEFFLLRPNVAQLEAVITRLSTEQLAATAPQISLFFTKCVDTIGETPDMRVVYAIQTLSALLMALHKRISPDASADVCDYLVSEDNQHYVDQLLARCKTLLSGEEEQGLVWWVLVLLQVIVQTDSKQLMARLLAFPLLDTLVRLLSVSPDRHRHGYDVVVLLTLLITYKKDQVPNPYMAEFSSLDDLCALNRFAQVIAQELSESVSSPAEEVSSGGIFSSIKGFLFSNDEQPHSRGGEEIVLLALYSAAYLNKYLMMTLDHSTASAQPSPACTLLSRQTPPSEAFVQALDNIQPTNLCVTLFYYCSVLMANLKSESNMNKVRVCLSTLVIITEDQVANATLHDPNLTFKVQLYRSPMRHRKIAPGEPASQTLAATLLDLIVEFIQCHLERKFPGELYSLCVAILQRLLSYQRSWKVRLVYDWKVLWNALITLLDFLQKNDAFVLKKNNNFSLALEVVNIFNLFITVGDTFLSCPGVYDQLYYELLRQKDVFQALSLVALCYSVGNSEYKGDALRLANALSNITAIINHFTPKIDSWLDKHQISTPAEKDIIDIILKGYDNLILKLHDNVDCFTRYEQTCDVPLLQQLRREACNRARNRLNLADTAHTDLLVAHYSAIEKSAAIAVTSETVGAIGVTSEATGTTSQATTVTSEAIGVTQQAEGMTSSAVGVDSKAEDVTSQSASDVTSSDVNVTSSAANVTSQANEVLEAA